MCGIAGIVRFDGISVDDGRIEQATAALAHRGPDDRGIFRSRVLRVALGHTRLAILDLSAAGHQPMIGCRPDLVLSFNGEIYNHESLRYELRQQGYVFRSRSDTEVLLHALDQWGDAVLPRLNGIFAYALLDERVGELRLVRDRFGIKPLYYFRNERTLVFASEIKAIIASGLYQAEPLLDAVPEYLRFRSVAGERTLLRDVVEVEPGSIVVINPQRRTVITRRFVDVAVKSERMGEEEAQHELRRRLQVAVRSQLQADVPVGSLNSGGLDSSVVAALAVAEAGPTLRTYCASFGGAEGGRFDESEYAAELASMLGTRHREVPIDAQEFFDLIEPLCWLFDEPLNHPNSIPLFKVFRAARADGVKVMLSGEGADELFGGYDFFTELALVDLLTRIKVADLAARWTRLGGRFAGRRWAALVDRWARVGPAAILDLVAFDRGIERMAREAWGPYRSAFLDDFGRGRDLFATGTDYVQRVYLRPLLQRADRMSMASGVECRVPYLDNEVAALANRMPRRFKRRLFPRRVGKVVLRQVAVGIVPKRVITRRKYGFAAPISAWLRGTEAGRASLAILREPRARFRPWMEGINVDAWLRTHERGENDLSARLWTFLTLEIWARCFLDAGGRGRASPVVARHDGAA